MSAGEHVVYPNAPARHVVLSVGYPEARMSSSRSDALRQELRAAFPLMEQGQQQSVVFDLGPDAGARQQMQTFPQFSTRDRRLTVAVMTERVVIEARSYVDFDWYRDTVRGPLAAVGAIMLPDGVTSIGHRFIDEVHLPADGLADLGRWFDPALLAMPTLPDQPVVGWQAVVSYRFADDAQTTLRYGPLEASIVPSPDGRVRRFANPVVGLDWDSQWQPSSVPEFEADAILDQLARMYAPVRSLFRQVCTDDLRRTFEVPPTGER